MTEDYCEMMDMPREGCAHCRDTGAYTVPEDVKKRGSGLNCRDTDGIVLELDHDGSVWIKPDQAARLGLQFIDPDEAFQRGKFGKGKRHDG